jgi:amino acid adenylation domain-containing protein/non-ribosomal peptide synthase protein (TIGR01720 family)
MPASLIELLRDRASGKSAAGWSLTFLREGSAEEPAFPDSAALDRRARSIAAALQDLARPGDRALLLYPPGPEFLAAFFGCLYARLLAVPVNVPARNHLFGRVEAVAEDAGVAVVLTSAASGFASRPWIRDSRTLASLPWLTTDSPDLPEPKAWRQEASSEEMGEEIAFLQYTSGSTSTPRGVRVSHANLLYDLEQMHAVWDLAPGSVMVTWLPQFHDLGLIYGLLQPVFSDIPCVMMSPASFVQQPLRWLDAISRHRGTHSAAPNFGYDLCLRKITPEQRERLDLSSWRMAMTGAEPIRWETMERFAAAFAPQGFRLETFCPAYGLAEATLAVTGNPTGPAPFSLCVDGAELQRDRAVPVPRGTPGSLVVPGCGAPLPGTEVLCVVPETGEVLPAGHVGEVWVGGPAVARGYWIEEEQDLFSARTVEGGPYLRTGDLGFLQDGELYVTGRRKDLIIIRGGNHYPQDIEAAAQESHPALRPSCGAAFSIDAAGEERLVVVQEVERVHRRQDPAEIFAAIRRAVTEAFDLQVYAISLLEPGGLLRTSSGKIQRRANREQFLAGTSRAVATWRQGEADLDAADPIPETAPREPELRAWIHAWLRRRLGIPSEEAGRADLFSDFGLDSAAAVELSGALGERLGVRLPETVAWDHPSVSRLAAHACRVVLGESAEAAVATRTQHRGSDRGVAVVGMACRFPGAPDTARFWELLRRGGDAVTGIPDDRPELAPLSEGRLQGGFLEGVDLFDAEFFHVSPREAARMDPQQRLAIETAWHALEDAGLTMPVLEGSRTAVFAAVSGGDYTARFHRAGLEEIDGFFPTGTSASILPARISYHLGLQGPSLAVDTACSSSLVALHLALRSLRDGECHLAIVVAVNLLLEPDLTVALGRAGMMAANGRCKVFDDRADGYVRGEGCGVLVLRRLDDALQDGGPVHGVIRGSAVNQDGRTNGMTAPNGPAQRAVIAEALADAGLAPSAIDYVETHGTGTLLGDPIEALALAEVFAAGRAARDPLLLGSVKTNVGHLEAAAGMAGVIKVLLALRHGEIPPHLHLETPNRRIPWSSLPFSVPTAPVPWPGRGERRTAGVSSFSFGGTNAHVILEGAPDLPGSAATAERRSRLYPVSARNPEALRELAAAHADLLESAADEDLADLCQSAATGRTHFSHRLAVVGDTPRSLAAALREVSIPSQVPDAPKTLRCAFLFTGQGSQSPDMGRRLFETWPAFRSALERCDEILRPHLDESLLGVLYADTPDPRLDDPLFAQPALVALEYALASLWRSVGIEPAALLGHSLGEYAAACVAGVLDLEDGLALVAERGRLMRRLPRGVMATVYGPEERVAEAIAGQSGIVALAAANAPGESVVSGEEAAVEAVLARLAGEGLEARRVRVPYAFHSALVEPILPDFEARLRAVRLREPRLTIVSCATGEVIGPAMADPGYWVRQMRQPVLFRAAIGTLGALGCNHFIEIGPHPVLLGLGRRCLEGPNLWLPSLERNTDDRESFLSSLAQLYGSGAKVDWTALDTDQGRRRRSLPLYPFQRQRHWWVPVSEGQSPLSRWSGRADGRGAGGEGRRPQTPPEETVATRPDPAAIRAALRQILGRILQVDPERIPEHASLLDLGAGSLILVEGASAIERRFGVALDRRELFRNLSTVAALADHLSTVAVVSSTPAAPSPAAKPEAPARPAQRHELAPMVGAAEEELDEGRRSHLENLVRRYAERTPGSKSYSASYRRALADSRFSAGFRPSIKEMLYPIVSHRAAGSRIWDVDGNEYVDTTMGFGVQLFGHGAPFVAEAVRRQLEMGLHLGPQSDLAGEVAAGICELTGVERVAFCNSGTEAVMTALRLARTATGRTRIALFSGSYHGHSDGVLVQAGGSGWGVPAALGVPPGAVGDVLVLDYSDPEGTLELVRRHGAELAAVLVEPVQSRRPALQPKELLKSLREVTREVGAALIFDEVLVGFRIHQGGAQAWAGVQADLVTYGKIIGGGMPIAVVAGRSEFMAGIDGGLWEFGDASGPTADATFFAGTFSKHPLSMAAASASIRHMREEGPALQERLNERTARMAASLNEFFRDACPGLCLDHFGSLFRFRFAGGDLNLLFYHLGEKGVYVWEGRTCFLSTAHTDEDIAHIERAVRESVLELRAARFLGGDQVVVPAAPPEPVLPLTPPQRALWIAASLGEEVSAAYNQSLVLDLRGELDLAAVRHALQAVVQRHEVLRAVFAEDGTHQRFVPPFAVEVPVIELAPAEAADRWLAAESRKPFQLDAGPLFRTAVLKLAPDWHRLVILLHHLITDGQSMALMLDEISALYRQAVAGQPLELQPPRQFREFIAAGAERIADGTAAAHEAYWQQRFDSLPPDLSLPLDRARPPLPTSAGGRVQRPLPGGEVPALQALAKQAGGTLFAVGLAGFAVLLARLSGQEDLVVGVPVDERPPELQTGLMGYCINVLPIRCRVTPDLPVPRLLEEVAGDLFDALAHRHHPFSALISDVLKRQERDPARLPLVSAALNLDRYNPSPDLPGLRTEVLGNAEGAVRWELFCNLIESPASQADLKIELDYNRDLFLDSTASRWLDAYLEILRALAVEPTVAGLFAAVDRVLTSVGGLRPSPPSPLPLHPSTPSPGEGRPHTPKTESKSPPLPGRGEGGRERGPGGEGPARLHRAVEHHARLRPDAPALRSPERLTTYAELDRAARLLAGRLERAGVEPGRPVAVLCGDGVDTIAAMLGIFRRGAVYVPLDPEAPPARLASLLDDCGAVALIADIADSRLAGLLPPGRPVLGLTTPDGTDDGGEPPPEHVHDVAYILYTSGSTGRPKGVAVTHANLAHYANGMSARLRPPAAGDWAVVSSLAADLGYTSVLAALYGGGCLHVLPRQTASDPLALAEYLERHPVDGMKIVPTHLSALLHVPEPAWLLPRSLLVLGGDRLEPSLVEQVAALRPGCEVFNHYGPTETTIGGIAGIASPSASGSVPLGHPLAGVRVHLPENGEPGEIHLGGGGVAAGYVGRPGLTAERFLPDPFAGEPGARMYRTGDLGRRLPDGRIEFLGRVDDQVKIRGHRVEPGEVETHLRALPGVREAAVVPGLRPGGERCLVAYAAATDETMTPERISALLAERLPEPLRPARVILLAALPRTANGKVDRKALPEPFAGAATSQDPASGELAQRLAEIWAEALGIERCGPEDNFFALGGDSIAAIRIAGRAARLGLRLSPQAIFAAPTVSRLLAAVPVIAAPPEGEPEPVVGTAPLTPVQTWFLEQGLPKHWSFSLLLRLSQPIDPPRLAAAFAALVRRHEALRLRIEASENGWRQRFPAPDESFPLEVVDLEACADDEIDSAVEELADRLHPGLDFEAGPILRAALVRSPGRPDRLVVVLHHLAVDGVSLRLLVDDLETALRDGLFPPRPASLARWTEGLARYADGNALAEIGLWTGPRPAVSIPFDLAEGADVEGSERTITLPLTVRETAAFLQASRGDGAASAEERLLAAVAAAFSPWIGGDSLRIDLEGHGREPILPGIPGMDLSQTFGWLTSHHPLDLPLGTNPRDLLERVRQAMRAIPHRGIGYGVLRYLSPPDGPAGVLREQPAPAVSFNYLGRFQRSAEEDSLVEVERFGVGRERDPGAPRPAAIAVEALVVDSRLRVLWRYSAARHRPATIAALAERCHEALKELIGASVPAPAEPDRPQSPTPQDFPEMGFTQSELDDLLADLAGSLQG